MQKDNVRLQKSLFLMWLHSALARWLRFGEVPELSSFACSSGHQLQATTWSIPVPLGTPVAQLAPVIPDYILPAKSS